MNFIHYGRTNLKSRNRQHRHHPHWPEQEPPNRLEPKTNDPNLQGYSKRHTRQHQVASGRCQGAKERRRNAVAAATDGG